MKKIFLVLFVLLFLQSVGSAQENSDIVATVNGQNITRTFINNSLQQELAKLSEKQKTEENIKMLTNKIINQKI